MPSTKGSVMRSIEVLWTVSCATTIILFSVSLSFQLLHEGLALHRVHGEFVLSRGGVERAVDQDIGRFFYSIDQSFTTILLIMLGLSLVVFLRNGTLAPGKIGLPLGLRYLIPVTSVALLVPIGILALILLGVVS